MKYPPFCDIILIGVSSKDEKELKEVIKKLHQYLRARLKNENIGMILYPPVSSPIDKIKNKYRWRIIIKCKIDEDIIELINSMLEEFRKIKILKDTRVNIDVNPNNLSQ